MSKKYTWGLFSILAILLVGALAFFFQDATFDVLDPRGAIAQQQRELMVIVTLLMLIVVIPVFVLVTLIVFKYRDGKNSEYDPSLEGNKALEVIWWTIPLAVIVVLSGVIWKSSHQLDPFRPVAAEKKPITVQVVSLQWKWLFIYPEQNIATVNYLQVPEDTPINFKLTSDAPMNSFWIPQLGGQVYTMSGMETSLHLIANEPGEYIGKSANLSGEGFAGMHFTTKATSDAEFEQWVQTVKQAPRNLTFEDYKTLAAPSENDTVKYYASKEKDLFKSIIQKYTAPGSTGHEEMH